MSTRIHLRKWPTCSLNGSRQTCKREIQGVSPLDQQFLHGVDIVACGVVQLADVLSPQHIPELLRCVPSLIPKLVSLLPEGLNLPPNPTADDLVPILTAPQFSEAIRSLDRALRSGGLPGSMMKDVGLDESAGQGVDEFLAAIKGSGSSGSVGEQGGGGQQDDRMEQD